MPKAIKMKIPLDGKLEWRQYQMKTWISKFILYFKEPLAPPRHSPPTPSDDNSSSSIRDVVECFMTRDVPAGFSRGLIERIKRIEIHSTNNQQFFFFFLQV